MLETPAGFLVIGLLLLIAYYCLIKDALRAMEKENDGLAQRDEARRTREQRWNAARKSGASVECKCGEPVTFTVSEDSQRCYVWHYDTKGQPSGFRRAKREDTHSEGEWKTTRWTYAAW